VGNIAAEIVGGAVVVDDIAGGGGAGSVVLRSPGGALSGDATIHKNSTFAEVTIVNHSDLDLTLNDIRSINPNPLEADLQIEGDPAEDTSAYTVVSDLGAAGDSPRVTIENISGSDVLLAGEIENPTGVTTIVNQGGDILGLPGAFLEGHEVILRADAGSIGADGAPLGVRLYADEERASLNAQAAGTIQLETQLLEIGESGVAVPPDHAISGAGLTGVVAGGDIGIHALQAQVLIPAVELGGVPTFILRAASTALGMPTVFSSCTAARLLDVRSAVRSVICAASLCSSSGTQLPCDVRIGSLRRVISVGVV
jgi:hypothetical protein